MGEGAGLCCTTACVCGFVTCMLVLMRDDDACDDDACYSHACVCKCDACNIACDEFVACVCFSVTLPACSGPMAAVRLLTAALYARMHRDDLYSVTIATK